MISKIKKIDFLIIIIVAVLIGIGLTALYSASQGAGGDINDYHKQITWVIVSGIAFIFFTFFDYKHLKKLGIIAYLGVFILLIAVLFSNRNNGATSWLRIGSASLQPAEFAKIALIIVVSALIDFFNKNNKLNKISSLIIIALIVAVPIGLIVKQPDYGTAIVILISIIAMLFIGGINTRYIIAAIIIACFSLPIIYNFVLPEHAKSRIITFLNPESDPRGAGYNVIQSKLAVGSGGLTGMGLLNGNQTQNGLLPMKTTDFIFSVISEEMGFAVSALIIVLYGLLLFRIIVISKTSRDTFGSLLCIGVFGVFFVHVLENIGMSMGLLPITGIPLPFISYGGSSMLTNMILLGICESVKIHPKKHLL